MCHTDDMATAPVAPVGRPRQFDQATERKLLLDAALKVMAANGYATANVADVLAESGLNTRSFYRHFRTKNDLFLAMFSRDAHAVGRQITKAVSAAKDPVEALGVWLDSYLDIFFEPRRAARVAVLQSPAARSAEGYDEALSAARELLIAPLITLLSEGAESEVMTSPDPEHDALTVLALVSSVTDPSWLGQHQSRSDARAHIMRFIAPALGLAT